MTRNGIAGWLSAFVLPCGFWYKHQWMTGWAWLAMGIICGVSTGGVLNFFIAPFAIVHAYRIKDLVKQ